MTEEAETLVKCPYCAELIQPEAVLCRFCKSELKKPPAITAPAITDKRDLSKLVACTSCGSIDTPKKYTPGSTLMEIFLYFCFVLPGLIYGIW